MAPRRPTGSQPLVGPPFRTKAIKKKGGTGAELQVGCSSRLRRPWRRQPLLARQVPGVATGVRVAGGSSVNVQASNHGAEDHTSKRKGLGSCSRQFWST